MKKLKGENLRIRKVSGNIDSSNKLVAFLYVLMRDHLPCGVVEEIIRAHVAKEKSEYCNGWLANYAKDISKRLT